MDLRQQYGWWIGLVLPAVVFGASADSRLVEAAKRADQTAVQSFLKSGVDVNSPTADGTTALHWAVQDNDGKLTDLLISSGADVKAANRYGVTPILLACTNGSASIVQKLLEAGADANAMLPEGDTALMIAARAGNLEAVKLLLLHGANVDSKEGWRGQTALMLAAAENHPDVMKILIEHGANVGAHSNLPVKTGATNRFTGYYDAGQGGFSPLLFAVREGHVQCAKLLLDESANPNDALPSGFSALTLAVLNAHYEVAALLLDKGANPNDDKIGFTALHQLVWSRDPNRHFNLPPPIPDGKVSDMELAQSLIAHGANVNARMTKEPRDGYRNWMHRAGATPFILAAKAEDVELMRFLLAHGADPKITAIDGTNALMAAAGIGFWPAESNGTEAEALEAVKLCLTLGYDVNAANGDGFTALHGAAVRGANPVVQLLYEKGAKLDAKTKNEHWMALNIADGVFLANTYKATPQTAAYLRQLMGIKTQRALGARNVYGVTEEQPEPKK
jgi:ankyrin repeat protein